MIKYFIGVDLGKKRDYTAISITERELIYSENRDIANVPDIVNVKYSTRYLYRPPLDTPYQKIVDYIDMLVKTPKLANQYVLVIDSTGVGEAVSEMFIASGLNPVFITITAGAKYNTTDTGYNVPKIDIITVLQILLQNEQYKVAKRLPLAEQFLKELQMYRYKIHESGSMTMEAKKESIHDDLVMSVGIAMWYAERIMPIIPHSSSKTIPDYNPYDYL